MLREGTLEVTIEGKSTIVGSGSVVYAASLEMHGWKKRGDHEGSILRHRPRQNRLVRCELAIRLFDLRRVHQRMNQDPVAQAQMLTSMQSDLRRRRILIESAGSERIHRQQSVIAHVPS